MGFLKFMSSVAGRWTRAIAGLALLAIGFITGLAWLGVVGAAVAAAGIFDFCIFAPLFSKPFMGPALREALKK